MGICDLNFHFSWPVSCSSACRCPSMAPKYTTPSAIAGEVTIGPPALNIHFTPPSCFGPAAG